MRAFGSDWVERTASEGAFLTSPMSKGWTARQPRTLTSPEFPGTAVRWEGALYEVREVEAHVTGSVRYRLAPWEKRHAARTVETYDAASEVVRQAEQDRRRRAVRKKRWSLLLAPLAGHLPARAQQRMESETGTSARLLTIASALPLLVLGVLGLLAFLLDSFGAGDTTLPRWPIPSLPIAAFLFLESAVRLAIAFLHGEPMGSIGGAVLYTLWCESCQILERRSRRYASRPHREAPTPRKENG